MRRVSTLSVILIGIVLCIIYPINIFAQSPDLTKSDSLKTYYLPEEVVVIGARGEKKLLKLPMAVSIVQSENFSSSRKTGLNEALQGVPGVFAQSRGGGQDVRLTIRGFGARGNGERSNAATIRGVKVLIDGFPASEPDGRTALDQVDLNTAERIEVVRSNASNLFGNASGGVVNIVSRSRFPESFVENNAILGSFGLGKNNLALGLTLGSARLLLSGSRTLFDGWRQHTGSSSSQYYAIFHSNPDANTHLKLLASFAHIRFRMAGALTQTQFDADPKQSNPTYLSRDERRFNRSGKLGFTLSKNVTKHHTIEVLGYVEPKVLERSERNTFRDFNRFHMGGGTVWSWKQKGDDSGLRISSGLDAGHQDGAVLFYELQNGQRGDSLRSNQKEAAGTFGLFTQGELPIQGKLRALVGGRFDRQLYVAQDLPTGAQAGAPKEKLIFNHVTPKVALLYLLSEEHSVYVQLGGGVEVPAFNEVDPPPTLPNTILNRFMKPMNSTTVELGSKGIAEIASLPFLRTFSYDLALYRIGIKNEIIPFDGGTWYFSAGKSRRYGFEAGMRATFVQGISAQGALTIMDAKYVSYANELGNFSGNQVPGIPRILFNGGVRWEAAFGATADFGFEHAGFYFADDANSIWVPSYFILNASLGYGVKFGNLCLEGFLGAGNLTDKRYAASGFINPSGSGSARAFLEPGLPRNYFGGFQLHFVP